MCVLSNRDTMLVSPLLARHIAVEPRLYGSWIANILNCSNGVNPTSVIAVFESMNEGLQDFVSAVLCKVWNKLTFLLRIIFSLEFLEDRTCGGRWRAVSTAGRLREDLPPLWIEGVGAHLLLKNRFQKHIQLPLLYTRTMLWTFLFLRNSASSDPPRICL